MTMQSNESWVTQKARQMLFQSSSAIRHAMQLLRRDPTNRIVTPKQARMLATLRLLGANLDAGREDSPWAFLTQLCNDLEDYQLTVGEPKNSRLAFVEALQLELQSEAARSGPVPG